MKLAERWLFIPEVVALLKRLTVGRTYMLEGVLEKGVDRGHKRVYIESFRPEAVK